MLDQAGKVGVDPGDGVDSEGSESESTGIPSNPQPCSNVLFCPALLVRIEFEAKFFKAKSFLYCFVAQSENKRPDSNC